MAEISTYKTAARDTYNANTETTLKREVSPILFHINESRMAPLNTLTGGTLYLDGMSKPQTVPGIIRKEKCPEYKYEILEKSSLNRKWTSGAAVADTTTTTIPFASTAGIQVGMTLRAKSAASPESICVLTVTADTNITARRNIGATTYTIAAGTVWVNVGWVGREGGDPRTMRSQIAAARTGYLQVFKNTFGITKTLKNSETILDQSTWEEEMAQAKQQHQFDKENSFWHNPAADSTTDVDGSTVFLLRGILSTLIANDRVSDCGGALTEDMFANALAAKCFEFGSDKKLLIGDPAFCGKLNSFAWVKQQTRARENKYGFSINEIETQFGVFNIISTGVFSAFMDESEAGIGAVLDPNELIYKFMANMDGAYEENIQTPGASRIEAQFESQIGLLIRKINNHRLIRNIGL
jgi:hypothetical protein